MTDEPGAPPASNPLPPARSPAAERALAEAEARRKGRVETEGVAPPELGGREGPDPVRFGDWEKGGIASDF